MDRLFMKMMSVVTVQTMSEESVTCIAVNDRHQNVMSTVALKKEVEETLTIESVAKFMHLT